MLTDDFTAYAAKAELKYTQPVSSEAVKKHLCAFLSLIASECADQGAYLIGHIKCVLESSEGFYAASVTSPLDAPAVRGEMNDSDTFEIVVNVLLYGLDKATVRSITKAAVPAAFDGFSCKIWDLEEEAAPISLA